MENTHSPTFKPGFKHLGERIVRSGLIVPCRFGKKTTAPWCADLQERKKSVSLAILLDRKSTVRCSSRPMFHPELRCRVAVVLQLLFLPLYLVFNSDWKIKYSFIDTNDLKHLILRKPENQKSYSRSRLQLQTEQHKTFYYIYIFFHDTLQQSCKKHCATQGWPLGAHSFKIDALTHKQVLQTGSSTVSDQVTQRPGNLEEPVIGLFNLCVFESTGTL